MSGWGNNMRRGLAPLQARQPRRAQTAEEWRDQLLTKVEAYIADLRETDPAAARDAEQQAKLLRLQNTATWWLDRRAWSVEALLQRPI
jgi:hypothetical protein